MFDRWVSKLGPSYIVWMMIATRLGGLFGGAAVIYYVRLTLNLTGELQHHFNTIAAIVVLIAVILTVLLALWGTRSLRAVMRHLHRGQAFPPELGSRAGQDAVTFPVRHHFREAIVVPIVCLVPIYIYLPWVADASITVLTHITIATMLGVACALSVTFFVIERLMHPVVRHLTDYGVLIDYEHLSAGRLQNRLIFAFTLIIVVTVVMIAALAHERVTAIIDLPGRLDEVVASLRTQTLYISGCAVVMAIVLATLLSKSITVRVQNMVNVMRRVELGHLDERITAISTDEIGMVGRSFNKMIARLESTQTVIRNLNTTLERKVEDRTRELAASKQELQESYEKLKAHDQLKTEFFSNISHELRTPLTLILSPVDNMLEGNLGELSAQHRQTLEIVRRNTVRLLNLINDLLDFARLEAKKTDLQLAATDVNAVIEELVSSASLLANERGIRLGFEPDRSLALVMVDPKKIEKVIINLLSNALKFTPKDGRVDIQTRQDNGQLVITVTDTGIGIAPEDHDKIYERFVQIDGSTSRRYDGTGLGLPMVKEFVELHGGQISLASDLGTGSCFSVTIPYVPAPAAEVIQDEDPFPTPTQTNYTEILAPAPGAEPVAADEGAAGAEKILIVDDSSDMVAVLRSILAANYTVIEAADGAAGLRRALEEHPDVIISDVMMPFMDGYELCANIRGNPATERIGFIMLTAKAELAMKIEGLDKGADDYLVKPFNPEELRARVRSLVKLRKLDRQLEKRNRELEEAILELKRTQDQLIHSEKMSSLGHLAAGIAHEINNSINAVYNGILPLREQLNDIRAVVDASMMHNAEHSNAPVVESGAAQKENESFAVIDELVEVIESGARRTTEIVSDLKNFAHPGRSERTVSNIHEAIDLALSLLSSKMKNRIEVHREYCENARIACSGAQLSQVFVNLVDNAQQAIDGRGHIHIATRRTDDHLVISIRDDGPGIPDAIQVEIFNPFFTTKDVGVGTGLGLAISYGIIRSHGGQIDVESPPPGCEDGTEFTIRLPLTTIEPNDEASNDSQAARMRATQKTKPLSVATLLE